MMFKQILHINFMNIKLRLKIIGGFSMKIAFFRKSKSKKVLVIRVKLRKILQMQIFSVFLKCINQTSIHFNSQNRHPVCWESHCIEGV